MGFPTNAPSLPAVVGSHLAGLRRRIRLYVVLEGLALFVAWIGLTFWIALGIDYLPVVVGATEFPWPFRALLLVVVAVGSGFIFYRWILRRAFVPLADRSMAMLVERRYQEFGDGLLTSVELGETPEHAASFDPRMLAQTREEAASLIPQVALRKIFAAIPLGGGMAAAVLLAGSIGAFAGINLPAFKFWIQRFYLLQEEPWPRSVRLSVDGIETVRREGAGSPLAADGGLVPFDRNEDGSWTPIKVAQGASVVVWVRADAAMATPEQCTIYYRSDDGDRGRVNMKRIGDIRHKGRESYQQYSFDGKPFKGILGSLDFDVRGQDHRLNGYRIEVVESPVVLQVEGACSFPKYMRDEALGVGLDRTIPITNATSLPLGTRVVVAATSNKDLAAVRVDRVYAEGKREEVPATVRGQDSKSGQGPGFAFEVPSLDDNAVFEAWMLDIDGIANEAPHKIVIGGVKDEAPKVELALRGIGSAVTPSVRIPVRGEVTDDYGVARSWFELISGEQDPREEAYKIGTQGKVDATIEFENLKSLEKPFKLEVGSKLTLTPMAADAFDLTGKPNVGVGDRFELEVVTPQQLIILLERRELGLRKRFEQIINELTSTRDSLIHLRRGDEEQVPGGEPGKSGAEPEDKIEGKPAPSTDDAKQAAKKAADEQRKTLRLLRVEQALMLGRKDSQELIGVAESFLEIREELLNNRGSLIEAEIDVDSRQKRLQADIALPIRKVVAEQFPEFERKIELLREKLETSQADAAAGDAIVQAEQILAELDNILQQLLKYENYNQLLDIIRSIIAEEETIIEGTKIERKKQALEALQD